MALIAEAATADAPRWVWWGRETSDLLAGLPIDRCWDVATVHRFLHGTWKAPIGVIWAVLQGLDPDSLPTMGQLGLLDAPVDEGDRELPIRPDGHLRPEWIAGAFAETPDRLATWAGLALDAMGQQILLLNRLPDPDRALATARSESAADLLCAEMTIAGLPIDVPEAERLISASAGRRPRTSAEEDEIRAERDERVLSKLESSQPVNLRNPGEVKAMLRRHGHDLPDTRAWRLEQLRTTDPLIDVLLTWRKDERIATTSVGTGSTSMCATAGFVASGRVRMAPPDACRHRPASIIFHRPCDRLSPPSPVIGSCEPTSARSSLACLPPCPVIVA